MNAILEPARKRLLTVDDYHRMAEAGIFGPDERVELIDGEIIAMPPPIGLARAGTIDYLTRQFVKAVDDRAIVRVQNPVRLSEHSEPEPDLPLLRPRDDFYRRGAPHPADILLLVEVSDSTLVHDRQFKVPLYARHGIAEVWVVDVKNERLITYREPSEGDYAHELEQRSMPAATLALLPDVTLDLTDSRVVRVYGSDRSDRQC